MQISVHGLSKRFGQLNVVDRVGFTIEEGELFTLLGPSGCGKTTLLRLMAGFYTPDDGEIRFDGRSVNRVPPDQRGIGMVFQNYALWPHMTVAQNVSYGLKLRKIRSAEIAARTEAILDKVKLSGLGSRYPGQLSGGQQQRVALARALVLNPKILLLDEPLSNLDAKIRVQVRAEIRKLQKELGITTVYVTHDQEEALTLSDRIAVLNQGRVFQLGPPRALYERPVNRFVADFIGVSNLIEGTVKAVDAGSRRVKVDTALGELSALHDVDFRPGDACVLAIRPENATLEAAERPDHNRLQGRISFAAYMGNTLRYDVDVGHGIVFKVDVRDPWHHTAYEPMSTVSIGFIASSTVAVRPE
jgi:spermidine/putrescine ABC transporter ATP-binding subunit